MNATQARALVALAALWLTMTAGAGAQRAGGPGDLQFVNVDGRIQYAKFKLPERLPEYPWPFGPRKPGQ
jgi:hypothetical protein